VFITLGLKQMPYFELVYLCKCFLLTKYFSGTGWQL